MELIGVLCIHVDDFCYGGNKEFNEQVIGNFRKRLQVGEIQSRKFCHIGVDVEQNEGEILLDQGNYVNKFRLPMGSDFKDREGLNAEEMKIYRGIIGRLNWVVQHSRPDLAFEVSEGGMAFQEAKGSDMVKLLKAAKKMKKETYKLRIQKLKGKVFWDVYSDASYGNVGEDKSQIGYIISLRDGYGNRCPIFWKSVRAKRVARTVVEAEALGFCEAAEMTIYLNKLMAEVIGTNTAEILVRTDNMTLRNGLNSSTGLKSRRLRIDIAAIREMILRREIQVEWVDANQQLADVLTKTDVSKRAIRKYMFGEEKTEKRGEV